ncbi:MAG TPA: hypothetical protein VGP51_02965 [Nocardioidaceae bacterium]|jgi:hypothetical protein|nr:hypothetical protein [Actinomycetota bacterium]MDQ3422585.1 hypothetical protein [Actinomycetota bacterium]HEV8055427.1 hypothetical protein [Nocardioidaceae bacterium]
MTILVALGSEPVDPDRVSAGGIGFLVIAGIAILTFLLWRSMNKQLRKVDFEERPDDEGAEQHEPPSRREDDPT